MVLALPRLSVRAKTGGIAPNLTALSRNKARADRSSLSAGALADTACRLYPFETRRGGEAHTVAPRTVGVACMVYPGAPMPSAADAADVIDRATGVPVSPEAAREKVGFSCPDGATAIFQADRQSHSATLCACGNATGAAAALLARHRLRTEVCQRLQLPDGQVEVQSTVARTGDGAWRVTQSWCGIALTVTETELFGRRAAVCQGGLNDYLMVRLPNRDELEAFDVPNALALWDAVRQPFGFDDLLRSRLAVFCPTEKLPCVKFYTCGRMHPGAPLTGSATLAIAAERVSWLAPLLRAGSIEHRRGIDLLPEVRSASTGTAITLPTIDVVLHST